MMNKLFDGFEGKLTADKWAKMTNCSHNTAINDISDLIDKGAMIRNEEGGRSTSYRLAPVQGGEKQ